MLEMTSVVSVDIAVLTVINVYARSSLEAEIRIDEPRRFHGEPVTRLDSVPECVVGLSRVGCSMRAVIAFISLSLTGGGDD